MNPIILVSITFLCYTNCANSLSLDFTATETPYRVLNYGNKRFEVQSVCDSTRECRLETQSRSQCYRWDCCWIPNANKCFAKKYFITSTEVEEQLVTKFSFAKDTS